ncbi:MAG TPA: GNAT family N-acetyltransferase, partial [Tepidisphaeraceae bacterium]|nr:GNAT family N-acetyltransferase [Tepidisphaeraceae bacterium]
AGYKSLGYRVQTTEPFMTHSLQRIPRFDAQVRIERVCTPELLERLNRSAGRAMIRREHLECPKQIRVYAALDGDKPIGWVRSIMVGNTAWCASVFVQPSHRRRGIARAMLVRMLRDDRAAGANASVLLASHTGALLYPVVGYRSLGTLIMFNPPAGVRRG